MLKAASAALLLALPMVSANADATPNRLEGRWKVTRISEGGRTLGVPSQVVMTIEFRTRDSSWSIETRTPERTETISGTWHLRRRILTTVEAGTGKTEQIRIGFRSKNQLYMREGKNRLHARRVPTKEHARPQPVSTHSPAR